MAKKINILWIKGGIVLLFIVFGGVNLGEQAVLPGATVQRSAPQVDPGAPVSVTLTFPGCNSLCGGIVGETIPAGFTVTGISSQSLGAQGTASGKLTGNLYEIAFGVNTIANPFITYGLSNTQPTGEYGISGVYEYADLGPSGSTGGEAILELCTPDCTRPADLCTQAATYGDGCNEFCSGQWSVVQNSQADSDCDNSVTNAELLSGISNWVNNIAPFDDNSVLLSAITAWVNS